MADILRPELMWIEGRCYRINDSTAENTLSLQEHEVYEQEMYDIDDTEDGDTGDEDYEIESFGDSRHRTSLHVPQHYMGYLIGKKGATRSRIERDTRTEIKIPRQGQSGDVLIVGSSIGNVKAARRRINMIVMSSRMKQRPTHFLSIPMNSPEIIENYNKFKDEILHELSDRGIEESVFVKPHKLHMTISVMCLMDNEERLQASKLLTEARDTIIIPTLREHKPLKLRLKGVSYMNDDPTSVHVLYGLVQEENAPAGLLQKLCNDLQNHFYKGGFAEKEKGGDNVKIHVTLMNSRHRGRTDESDNRNLGPRESFDATRILEKYAHYDFGVAEVTDVHLSQMHTSTEQNAYYESTCVVPCFSS